jgi:hypothetical protein
LGGFYKKLPHLLTVDRNLKEIENVGVSDWLARQEKEWHCTACHTKLSWYTKESHQCPEK